jgi:serine/threonine protein kinase
MSDLAGKMLGPYQIVSVIGQGGMGIVYKALQPSLNRYVAIKVLPSYLAQDEDFVQRFRHEATIAASLQHPNILNVYDVGQEDHLHYIVMQLLEGCTLAQLLEREKVLPLARTARIISQMASALDCAHQHQLVHRDVKPSNIFVGPGDHATLMDFGIVKALSGTRLTRTGVTVGTPEYMSPEQIEGQVLDHRSDLYSLGVVLYQMVTGRAPFVADTPNSVLYAHVHKPPVPPSQLNSSIVQPVEAVVLKALAKDPQARYQSGAEMAAALDTATQQSESLMLENLYAKAVRLRVEWKMDEAVATWEQLRQIRPDYKDAAAQMALAQRQRDIYREYRDLVQAIRHDREWAASFAQRNPDFADPERIFKPEVRPGRTIRLVSILPITVGILLIVGATVIALWGYYRQIQPSAPGLPKSLILQLLSWGNFNIGLGIGLGIAGLVLLLLPLVTILNRLLQRR